ncbi:hypothetical protein HDU78_004416 [Chytriomyces hyalinus]|nr:hypothetical protein HDU78_004416 [Chytriomyces hyalinus]
MFSWIGNLVHGISAADPVEEARNASESRLLSDAEIDHLVAIFQSLQSTTNKADFETVEKWVKQKSGSEAIAQSFVVCMWSSMLSNSVPASSNSGIASEASVSMRDFVVSVALCSRGSWSARRQMVLSLAKDSLELASIVGSALSLFTNQQSPTACHVVTPRFAKFLVKESNASKSESDPFDHAPKDAIPDIQTVELWAPKARLMNELWNALFGAIFFDAQAQSLQIPTIMHSEPLLLSTEDLFVLSSNIKPLSRASLSSSSLTPIQETWQLIYSTETHGKSWGSLTSRIEAAGTLLILIRDTQGHTFGAYASSPLECCPRFFGTNDTFLFTLEPDLRIFREVGVNSNYMYFNYGTATLPNGIGFGGQLGYFGLWIDSSFSFGSCSASPTSSTFESPKLCAPGYGDGKFEIDVMQVILVHPKEVDDRLVPERVKRGGASILSSNPVESALLEMAGKERFSYE